MLGQKWFIYIIIANLSQHDLSRLHKSKKCVIVRSILTFPRASSMHKPIVGARNLSLQKEVEPELEASTQTLVTHNSAPAKKPFPWRMLLTLIIGIPAAAIGLLMGGFYLLVLVFGGMDCGGSVPSADTPPLAKPAPPTSPR